MTGFIVLAYGYKHPHGAEAVIVDIVAWIIVIGVIAGVVILWYIFFHDDRPKCPKCAGAGHFSDVAGAPPCEVCGGSGRVSGL